MHNDKTFNELIQKAHNGDKEARDTIVMNSIRLVYYVIHKRKDWRGTTDFEALVNEGVIGLMKAVDKFDIEKGCKFSTYAVQWIEGQIGLFVRDKREDKPFRIMRTDTAKYREIKKTKKDLSNQLGRESTNKEIAEILKLESHEVARIENIFEMQKSLDEPNNDDCILLNLLADDEDHYKQMNDKILIEQLLEKLNDEEKQIMELRFAQQFSQRKVAKVLNTNQARVSRLERKAIEKMRRCYKKII